MMHTLYIHKYQHEVCITLRVVTFVGGGTPEQTVLESDDRTQLLLDATQTLHRVAAEVELVSLLVSLQQHQDVRQEKGIQFCEHR